MRMKSGKPKSIQSENIFHVENDIKEVRAVVLYRIASELDGEQ